MRNYYFFHVKSNKYDIDEMLIRVAEVRYLSVGEHIAFIHRELLSKGKFKRAKLYISKYTEGEASIEDIVNTNLSIYRCLEQEINRKKMERAYEIIKSVGEYFKYTVMSNRHSV